MVNYCMVPGCSIRTRKRKTVSFHLLPRDLELCKQWLRAINHKFGEDTALEAVKQRKVCSLHFKPEDFEFNVLRKKRAALLNSAIPSIFTFPGDDEQPSGTSSAKRSCLETAPCEESCLGITVDLSEFTFDEENNCSNEAGGKAEVENNSSEEGGEEEDEEEKDDRDSDWENEDSDQLESDDSGDSTGSDLKSESTLPKKVRHLCPECGAFFYTGKPHTCEYKIKPFSCNFCGKRCADVNSLKIHSAIHKESYRHPCKFCLAPFKTKFDKHAHEGAHKPSSKPYACPDCSSKFAKIHARNRHLREHRGPKRFPCPHCALEFPTLNHLERHTVVHTGMKEHVCEFCSRSFNQRSHLKSHLRVHTGEKPFQCQHCDKSFNHNVSLKSHVMRYHKEDASDSGLSAPVKRTKRASMGRPKGRPKRITATNSVCAVQGEAPDPPTAAETSGKGHLRKDSSGDMDTDSDWSDKDPSYELTEEDKAEESKGVRKSKRKASQRSMTDYIVEKDSESESDSNPEEEAKKRKVVKSQET